METRYIVDRTTVETFTEQRISDVEMELFRGIQEINKEKGRREIRNTTPATSQSTKQDEDDIKIEGNSEDFSFQSATPKVSTTVYEEPTELKNGPNDAIGSP